METPESKRQSLPGRKKKNGILGSPLFLIANTILLASNLALTESDQRVPETEPKLRDNTYPADASVERQGVTIFETENFLDPQGNVLDPEKKYREKLMDIIDPKFIRPVYKVPPKDEANADKPIEL